jgi:hypothetical protein
LAVDEGNAIDVSVPAGRLARRAGVQRQPAIDVSIKEDAQIRRYIEICERELKELLDRLGLLPVRLTPA